MDLQIWVLGMFVTIAVLIGLAIAFVLISRRRGIEMTGKDYRYFFYIGVVYLAIGIALSFVYPQDTSFFNFFVFMGLIFTAMGLANIDKWKR